jgi:hypothetical protein
MAFLLLYVLHAVQDFSLSLHCTSQWSIYSGCNGDRVRDLGSSSPASAGSGIGSDNFLMKQKGMVCGRVRRRAENYKHLQTYCDR